ncbi:unnamed protein product, partial [Gordionus sp. m RMFG-2023]
LYLKPQIIESRSGSNEFMPSQNKKSELFIIFCIVSKTLGVDMNFNYYREKKIEKKPHNIHTNIDI